MRVYADPPLRQWQIRRNPTSYQDRSELRDLLANQPGEGTAAKAADLSSIVATGHQAWLWHPGILAKDVAMAIAARQSEAAMFHLVVDQDVHEIFRLDLPVIENDRLRVETLHLAPENVTLPAASQKPADADLICRNLENARDRLGDRLPVDLVPLIAAFTDLPRTNSLGEQMGAVTQRLMAPWTGPVPLLFASQLPNLTTFQELVAHMLADARRCVACYNRAAALHPEARVAALHEDIERVELPLWALAPGQPRRRVFADLGGNKPLLALENGDLLHTGPPSMPDSPRLAPRALLMTGFLRLFCCDLFIHGKGGALYEPITEAWFRQWTGQELAPMAMVSADGQLPLNVPVADRAQLDKAVWWAHHVPHNIDRAMSPAMAARERSLIARKTEQLEHMDDDRDKQRRAAAFTEVRRINKVLAVVHPHFRVEADQQLEQARLGVANQHVAGKRDWCFALYPSVRLEALQRTLAE